MDADKAKERSAQLRFGKAEFGEEIAKPKRRKPGAEALLGGEAHRQIDKQNQDENAGVQAAHEGERLAEGTAKKLKDGKYSKKLKAYKKAEKLDKAADKANIQALRRKQQAAQPTSNPISRWKQRQQIKASYYARKTGSKMSGGAANTARSAATPEGQSRRSQSGAVRFHPRSHAPDGRRAGAADPGDLLLYHVLLGCSSRAGWARSGPLPTPPRTRTFWARRPTTRPWKKPCGPRSRPSPPATRTTTSIPGIWTPITHDPHQLAAVLTAIHEAYTRGEVQGTMQSIFDAQYEIILTETIEIRTRTETRTGTDPTTGDTYTYEVEVQYEWRILNITLLNFGIDSVARGMLSGDDLDRYDILQETQGNRPELFGGGVGGVWLGRLGETGIDYEVPAEALSDPEFCRHAGGSREVSRHPLRLGRLVAGNRL